MRDPELYFYVFICVMCNAVTIFQSMHLFLEAAIRFSIVIRAAHYRYRTVPVMRACPMSYELQ